MIEIWNKMSSGYGSCYEITLPKNVPTGNSSNLEYIMIKEKQIVRVHYVDSDIICRKKFFFGISTHPIGFFWKEYDWIESYLNNHHWKTFCESHLSEIVDLHDSLVHRQISGCDFPSEADSTVIDEDIHSAMDCKDFLHTQWKLTEIRQIKYNYLGNVPSCLQ